MAAVNPRRTRPDVRVPELEHGAGPRRPGGDERTGNGCGTCREHEGIVEDEWEHPRTAIERGDHERRDLGEHVGASAQTRFERRGYAPLARTDPHQ